MQPANDKGLFPISAAMPCAPSSIPLTLRYALPGKLGNVEQEEVAARILLLSQQAGTWVGVSWLRLQQQMVEDYEVWRERNQVEEHNRRESDALMKTEWKRLLLGILTLGIYPLCTRKPSANLCEVPEVTAPHSLIYMFGPNMIQRGIHMLIQRGMLRLENHGAGAEEISVLFPTPSLVKSIM